MQSRALFLLIWDWPGETDRHIMAEEEEADGYMYRNHILPHWLDYIKSLSKGSPVIIVQNKIDAHRTKPAPNQKAIEVEYDVRYFHHVSAKNGRGINDLKEIIKEAIQEMPEWNLELPGSWHELRLTIREKARSQTYITKEDFEHLCEEVGVKEVSRPSLLKYLHDTGVLFYGKDLSHEQIILDQQWVIQAVNSLFNPKGLFWLLLSRGNGQFDFEMLETYWRQQEGFSKEKSRLALSYMLNAEICYRLNSPDAHKGEIDLYIAPQLLPEKLPEARRQLWPSKGSFLSFKYEYLHQVFIHRLIVRAGKLSHPQNVWKRGIWFLWENTHALIQAQEDSLSPGGYIQLQVSGPKEEELLHRIRKEFDQIHPRSINHTCVVSLDGRGWINLEEINSARKNQLEEFISSKGAKIILKQYSIFFDDQKGIEDRKDIGDKKDIVDKQDNRAKSKEGGIQDLEPTRHEPLSKELAEKWRKQVAKNQLESVLEAMLPYIISNDLAIQTSARYYELQTQIHSGTMAEADKELLKNKLTKSVLYMIKELENQIL
ncbi:MAG: hypothetical protein KDE26_24170 [Bacteroidetes bacterium]|nr:hypothetical protein [Bacteroidota bacterium]MCB0846375.1 hypothetical protein [Bacteroidota bacterium]